MGVWVTLSPWLVQFSNSATATPVQRHRRRPGRCSYLVRPWRLSSGDSVRTDWADGRRPLGSLHLIDPSSCNQSVAYL
ncbi:MULTISPECIES: hypothetical protein [unclassified Bradyrhizobium]|uniref:hypothetical protein n=1 Tax=unclassified Bradyrhizobium TaxID=2631580 RepID=UPI0033918579